MSSHKPVKGTSVVVTTLSRLEDLKRQPRALRTHSSQVEPDRDNLRHYRPPLWIIADPPWHIDAVEGRSHHQRQVLLPTKLDPLINGINRAIGWSDNTAFPVELESSKAYGNVFLCTRGDVDTYCLSCVSWHQKLSSAMVIVPSEI